MKTISKLSIAIFLLCSCHSISGDRARKLSHLKKTTYSLRDYQIECSDDSMTIYDHNRKVGVIDYADDSKLANIVLKDNQ